jgi:hypothetical protein
VPRTPATGCPASSTGGPLDNIDRSRARLVGTIDGHDVYLAPGPDDSLCVLDVEEGAVGGTCAARETIKDHPVYSAWRDGDSTTATVVVPVADAYDSADVDGQPVDVVDNVAWTQVHVGKGTIRLQGDGQTLEGELNLSD